MTGLENTSSKLMHTPGPWKAIKEAHGDTYALFGPGRDDIIAHLLEVMPAHVIAANARLIAAAPDLLAACKLADRELSRLGATLNDRHVIRAAIAKATGN